MLLLPVLLAALLALAPSLAPDPPAPPPTDVRSRIDRVTVFLRGAQVTRTAAASVPAGTTELRFVGLTRGLDPSSVQLRADGPVTVLSVVHRTNFLDPSVPSPEAERLRARIEALEDSLSLDGALLEVLAQEEELLLANKDLGGAEGGVAVDELRAAADFYRARLREIKTEALRLRAEMEALREEQRRLQQQLGEIDARRRDDATGEVSVTVSADRPARVAFELAYVTPQAAWSPLYDLRVDEVGEPMALAYKAQVRQSTGEPWDDVRLTLSTGNPSRGGTRPTLSPWWLGFVRKPDAPQSFAQMEEVVVADDAVRSRAEGASLPVPVTTSETATTVEFAVALPYTVPPDGQPQTVAVQQHEVPARYAYYAAPKLAPSAYLTARLTDWDDFYLLGGPANVFFEGTYVGRTTLSPQQVDDTLVVSLGVDDGVVVRRVKEDTFTETTLFGSKRVETRGFVLEVRNAKRRAVELVIQDQVPVSTNEAIEVRVEADGAEVDDDTGLLTWRLTLPPGATERLPFSYTVRYPRDERVVLE